jgi:hypothetical protein
MTLPVQPHSSLHYSTALVTKPLNKYLYTVVPTVEHVALDWSHATSLLVDNAALGAGRIPPASTVEFKLKLTWLSLALHSESLGHPARAFTRAFKALPAFKLTM